MEELARRYTQAADGFARDPARAAALLEKADINIKKIAAELLLLYL